MSPDKLQKLRKYRKILIICCLVAIAWLVLAAYSEGYIHFGKGLGHPAIERIIKDGKSPNDALSLVTEPQDGTAQVVRMIQNAKSSLDMVMYSLNDKTVEAALASAQARGVAVRVILNGGYQGMEPPSKKSTTTFTRVAAKGVPVKWSKPYFDLTHQKTLIVDNSEALIMTGNLDRSYYKKDRDFEVVDDNAADVAAIESAFVSDWNGTKKTAGDGTDLIWSPGSEGELVALIASAKHSLLIYNEEMNDEHVEDALENAARHGVNVQVCMTMDAGWLPAFTSLNAAGVHIRTFGAKSPIYIHAKMIVADGKLAFLGSENFSDGSLDANRELGLLFSKPAILNKLISQFQIDWDQASSFP